MVVLPKKRYRLRYQRCDGSVSRAVESRLLLEVQEFRDDEFYVPTEEAWKRYLQEEKISEESYSRQHGLPPQCVHDWETRSRGWVSATHIPMYALVEVGRFGKGKKIMSDFVPGMLNGAKQDAGGGEMNRRNFFGAATILIAAPIAPKRIFQVANLEEFQLQKFQIFALQDIKNFQVEYNA